MKGFIVGIFLASLTILATAQEGSLRHVVSFKFKEDATKEQIGALVSAFADLENEIEEATTPAKFDGVAEPARRNSEA